MKNILIRNLEDKVVAKLKAQAKKNGTSLQAEARLALIERANATDIQAFRRTALKWQRYWKRRKRQFGDSTKLIREDRKR